MFEAGWCFRCGRVLDAAAAAAVGGERLDWPVVLELAIIGKQHELRDEARSLGFELPVKAGVGPDDARERKAYGLWLGSVRAEGEAVAC